MEQQCIWKMELLLTVGNKSNVAFVANYNHNGGAIWISNGTMNIDYRARLWFGYSSAGLYSGREQLD